MIKLNSLILNGKSSADFPFYVAVEEVPGVVRANKKDKIFQHEHMSGAVKQKVNAWEPISLEFKFYLHDVTRQQLRLFKAWFGYEGTLTRYDDPKIHYNYLQVVLSSKPMDMTSGYEVTATFLCEPFEYEATKVVYVGDRIDNHTTAPMYPRLTIKGNTGNETFLTIGAETMYFKQGIRGTVVVECRHGFQNVMLENGTLINQQVRGGFFEIAVGQSKVTKGPGITEVNMLARWGWV